MAFPTTLPAYTDAAPAETLQSMHSGTGHVAQSNLTGNDVVALGTKLGTGATTPAIGLELLGTGTGTTAWKIRPSCAVTHTVDQSIANNAVTALAFNTERYDHDTMHDSVTNNSRLICKTAGKFLITGSVAWESNSTNARFLAIRLGGGTYLAISRQNATTTSEQIVACQQAMAVNEYVELVVFQNSGGALNVTKSSAYSPEFAMVWIGGG